MKHFPAPLFFLLAVLTATAMAEPFTLTRADYEDRVNAIWHGQIISVIATLPFEHKAASVKEVTGFPKAYTQSFVDDDWYYEMCAVRAFEKHGIDLTVRQLGEQWLENSCGSWGSSAVTLKNLRAGIPAPDCGHPRHNRLWWTIGPVFTADLYGALAPGLPNEAARMARQYCAINGYGEALDGAVIFAGAISLGFTESDVRTVLKKAVTLVHPDSPYRQSIDNVIQMAEAGRSFEEIVDAVEDRWRIEYPASNNAVSNGGITAASLWFGEGDFWKTVNLAARAADFSDTDNSAATVISIIAAMHGMKALPQELVAQLGDRIVGEKMGGVQLTPPVDESITGLAARTAAIGVKILAARGAAIASDGISITPQEPVEQPAQRFVLNDLMSFWNADWTLDRAGFGGDDVGAMPGIRGITALDGDTLVTWPRDETRGVVLRRTATLGPAPVLAFEVAAEPGKAWELLVYADNRQLLTQLIDGDGEKIQWQPIEVDLKDFAGRETHLRLYQRTLMPRLNKLPGNARWRNLILR